MQAMRNKKNPEQNPKIIQARKNDPRMPTTTSHIPRNLKGIIRPKITQENKEIIKSNSGILNDIVSELKTEIEELRIKLIDRRKQFADLQTSKYKCGWYILVDEIRQTEEYIAEACEELKFIQSAYNNQVVTLGLFSIVHKRKRSAVQRFLQDPHYDPTITTLIMEFWTADL